MKRLALLLILEYRLRRVRRARLLYELEGDRLAALANWWPQHYQGTLRIRP